MRPKEAYHLVLSRIYPPWAHSSTPIAAGGVMQLCNNLHNLLYFKYVSYMEVCRGGLFWRFAFKELRTPYNCSEPQQWPHLSVRDKTACPRTDSPAPRPRQLPPRKTRRWPPDTGSHRVETTTIQRAGANGSGMSNTNATPDTARFRKVRCSYPWPDQSVTSKHRRLGVGIR